MILTFRTCVALHNLLIDERIKTFNNNGSDRVRVVQIPNHAITQDPSYHEVPEVNEADGDEISLCSHTNMDNIVESDSDNDSDTDTDLNRRNKYVKKIYMAGYVRPRTTEWQTIALQL